MLPYERVEREQQSSLQSMSSENGRTVHFHDALETNAVETKSQRRYVNEHSQNSLGAPL
jgi:hypothetical protein